MKKLAAKTRTFYTIANGGRTYTDEDGVEGYKYNKIIDPHKVTFINLFVNGVLQPQELYTVSKGLLNIKSDMPPEKGTPIVLQFVKIYIKNFRKKRIKFEE